MNILSVRTKFVAAVVPLFLNAAACADAGESRDAARSQEAEASSSGAAIAAPLDAGGEASRFDGAATYDSAPSLDGGAADSMAPSCTQAEACVRAQLSDQQAVDALTLLRHCQRCTAASSTSCDDILDSLGSPDPMRTDRIVLDRSRSCL